MSPEITEAYQDPPVDGTNPQVALDNEAKAKAEAYQGDIHPADMTVSPQSKPKLESETKEVGVEGDTRVIAANASRDTYDYGTETPDRPTPPTNYTSEAQETHPGTPPTPPELPPEAADAEKLPDEPVEPEEPPVEPPPPETPA